VAPIASGSLYTKVNRGYRELLEAGLAEGSVPAAFGAQAAGCGPVAAAFEAGEEHVRPVRPDTLAHSLAIGAPADGERALAVARGSGGEIAAVTDDEIVEAIGLLARTTGIFTEPAGGVTIATLAKLAREGRIDPEGCTVAYVTGDGLKAPDAALAHVDPQRVEADIDAVDEALAVLA
jgi:threonine synthase